MCSYVVKRDLKSENVMGGKKTDLSVGFVQLFLKCSDKDV